MKKLILCSCALCLIGATMVTGQSIVGDWLMPGTTPDGVEITNLVSFKSDGKMTVDFGNDGVVDVNMTYELDDAQVVLMDNTPESPCYNKKGVYKVEISASEMNMELVEDACDERRGDGSPMTMKRSE